MRVFLIFTIVFCEAILLHLHANDYRTVTFKQIEAEGKVWGIDLSHHQADVDWLKLEEQKPHFIFFKATEGATHSDRKYAENYKQARKRDIIVGSYHFFSYRSNGKAQALHFLRTAHYKEGDLPLVLDAEYAKVMPAAKTVTKELLSFMKTVNHKTGRKPIIYCDYDFYKQYLAKEINSDYMLWICDYRRKPSCDWTFWQTTDLFRIAGIKGPIDFNIFNGTKSDLKKLLF